jgi:hypothetical protein
MFIFTKTPRQGDASNTPGKLDLRIIGFSKQSIISIQQIIQAIDILPSFHLEGLREIIYDPEFLENDLSNLYAIRPIQNRKGEFRQKERKIVFFEFDQPKLFYQILYHEIGHFVFFLAINSRVKKQWVTEIYPHSECITAYGSVNACEDFAETYATYICDPDALKQLPIKYAFMRDYIFSGRPETLKEKNIPT